MFLDSEFVQEQRTRIGKLYLRQSAVVLEAKCCFWGGNLGAALCFQDYNTLFPQFTNTYGVLFAEQMMQHSGKHVHVQTVGIKFKMSIYFSKDSTKIAHQMLMLFHSVY